MRRFLLDTGIASDYMHQRHNVFQKACKEGVSGNRIGICMPVLGELWFGVEMSASRQRNAERLERMLPDLIVWPYEKKAAEKFGYLPAQLRRQGRPIQQIDIQIAAIALTLGNTTVVSTDTDFAAVAGLSVENWAQP